MCVAACPSGQYSTGTPPACQPCPQGSYQNVTNQLSCIPCPQFYNTAGQGASDISACLGIQSVIVVRVRVMVRVRVRVNVGNDYVRVLQTCVHWTPLIARTAASVRLMSTPSRRLVRAPSSSLVIVVDRSAGCCG